MGKHETITAEISDAMAVSIREAVEAGDFSDAADVVRHALTEWRIAERMPKIGSNELQAMLEHGLDGPGIPMDEVFEELEARLNALVLEQERDA